MSSAKKKRGIALLAHGSRDPIWKEPFISLEKKLTISMPETAVRAAFLKDCTPDIDNAVSDMIDAGADQITVIPLFLAIGAHSRNDFPTIAKTLEEKWPDISFEWAEVIGEWEEMQSALGEVIKDRFL